MRSEVSVMVETKLIVKRISSYGSNPWAIVNVETGQVCVGPDVEVEHPTLGRTIIMGVLYYARKRDAQIVLDAYLQQ